METVTKANLGQAITERMNFLVARQNVVSGNIANAATPGYIARDLKFQKSLKGNMRLSGTNGKHIKANKGGLANATLEEDKENIKNNGNSVVVANEMLKLNDIQLNYTFMTQLYAKHAQMQKIAIGRNQ